MRLSCDLIVTKWISMSFTWLITVLFRSQFGTREKNGILDGLKTKAQVTNYKILFK